MVFKFGSLAPNQPYKNIGGFEFGGGASGLFIKEHCRLSLEVPEQSHEILQGIKLAEC